MTSPNEKGSGQLMGFESFRVELHDGHRQFGEVNEAVGKLENVVPDEQGLQLQGSAYYLMKAGAHVLEIEVMDSPVKISCRFTLCHPPSVDLAFLGVVKQLMATLGMKARICDDVPPEQRHSFSLDTFEEFSAIVSRSIAARRREWIETFGTEQVPATTNEVYERIILPHCQGGVA